MLVEQGAALQEAGIECVGVGAVAVVVDAVTFVGAEVQFSVAAVDAQVAGDVSKEFEGEGPEREQFEGWC